MDIHTKTICVDFDGVIHKYSKGYKDGSIYDEPVEGAFETIERMLKIHNVVILSTREPKQIFEWLLARKDWHLPIKVIPPNTLVWEEKGIVGITCRKVKALFYIDDKGLRFTNWKDMLNYVR